MEEVIMVNFVHHTSHRYDGDTRKPGTKPLIGTIKEPSDEQMEIQENGCFDDA